MKFLSILALPLAATAMVTKGGYQKYKCMTLDKWEKTNEPCAVACTDYALKADGCHKDDFYCHCQRTQRIDDVRTRTVSVKGYRYQRLSL